jgi:ligand-binding sensor domain-containing protein
MSAGQDSRQRTLHRKCPYLLLTLLLSLLAGWLLVHGVHARDVSLSVLTDEPAYVLGEPCGSGELLPEWTLCLHGSVALDDTGETSLLAGVPITVTYGNQVVTGTTFVHPGQTTPTYGLDISPLEPEFLKPVTVTTDVSSTRVTRQVVVYPDFRTQNQRFDLRVPTVGALDPAPVWGSVVEFSARGPVTGATVTATANGHAVSVTTALHTAYESPIYTLSQTDLDRLEVTTGDPLTLTAAYGGDSDRRVITVEEAAQQVNFVTGWKCDGFDPLPRTSGGEGMPRTSGGEGMPRTSGGEGMPNVACFWGYGVVDGEPRAGVDVYLEISGTVHTGATQDVAGEDLPRYGIGVWGGKILSGTEASVTGTYQGFTATQNFTVKSSAPMSQRVDLSLETTSGLLANFTNGNDVSALAWYKGYLWAGTTGGVVRWDPSTRSYTQFTTNGALPHNSVRAVAVGPEGALWFGTGSGVTRYKANDTPEWQTFGLAEGIPGQVDAIAVAPDGAIWFGGVGVTRHYPGEAPEWAHFSTSDGLIYGAVSSIAVEPNGVLWFGTYRGVSRYEPGGDPEWQSFTTADGLVDDRITSIAVGQDGALWFGTDGRFSVDAGGVSRYQPGDTPEWQSFTTTHGLVHNDVYAVLVGTDGAIWFGTYGGIGRYQPDQDPEWQTFTVEDLAVNHVRAMAAGEGDTVWFGTSGGGISRYQPHDSPEWQTYLTDGGLAHNEVHAITVSPDHTLWFGTDGGVSSYQRGRTPEWEIIRIVSNDPEDNWVRAVAAEPDGTIWFGTDSYWHGVSRYRPDERLVEFTAADGLAHPRVNAITVGPEGALWFGTLGGVSRYEPGGNPEWTTFMDSDGLVHNNVRSIGVGPDGALWFGTIYGLSRYKSDEDPAWQTYTDAEGLVNNNVRTIASAPDGSLWFGTGNGVSRLKPGSLPEWQSFTTTHGLADHNVNAILAEQDGTLWFGTSNGLSRYRPGDNPAWQTFTTAHGLASDRIYAIEKGPEGHLWVGTDHGLSRWEVIAPQSDLALHMNVVRAPQVHASVTYTLHIMNHGVVPADSELTITLPISTSFFSAIPSPTTISPLTWSLDTLAPGGGATTITVTAGINADVVAGTTLTAMGEVATSAPESYHGNNTAEIATQVRDPDRADARVSLAGPAILVPGADAVYTIWADDVGALDAQTPTVTVALPTSLAYQGAHPEPASVSPPTWQLETLASDATPVQILLTTTVASALPAGADLAVTAAITTSTPDADPLNNTATVTTSTALTDALTLILVAPARLTDAYGASPLLAKLHQVAAHPRVQGVVVDVLADPTVRSAYADWDADPGNVTQANAVVEAIKVLIDDYTLTYPNLQYMVLVGNDALLPFYRVRDQNATHWHERGYCPHTPAGTVKSALCADYFLTDDFYAAPAPTYPSSPFWQDGHPFYLPELAVGRLVETPEEMIAAIDAFLETDGELEIDPALIGTHNQLVDDLGDLQCALFQDAGLAASCITQPGEFRSQVLQTLWGTISAAFHSNHRNLGQLSAFDLLNVDVEETGTLLAAIGCHSGTSVDDGDNPYLSYDLPQAFQQHGWPLIAPTAYAYASPFGIEYSEALMVELTEQLLGGEEEIGQMLAQAKQIYYADRGWFDYTDEKVLLPMTLYGFPMLRVTRPQVVRLRATETASSPDVRELEHLTLLTYTLDALTFTLHTTGEGAYYAYQDQIIAQDMYPIQPNEKIPLPTRVDDRVLRGIRLQRADYIDETPFDPVSAQSWAIGEPQPKWMQEPAHTFPHWDRAFPHRLGRYRGVEEDKATLNLTLGAFNAETETERRFTDLNIEVFYGTGEDQTAPEIVTSSGFNAAFGHVFYAVVEDESEVWQVTALCDDGSGTWSQLPLELDESGGWTGRTQSPIVRYYLQAVDINGNVTRTGWRTPTAGQRLYLPLVLR